jgi:hypothetical protein
MNERILRYFDLDELEMRAGKGEGERRLSGHGAVYDKLSVDLGGYRELFEQGTFSDSIAKDDIRSLRDHNSSYILGRTKSGTLLLEEDKKGVKFDVSLPDTSYANDLVVSVERKDVTGCSIIFSVEQERWFVDGEEVEFLDALMAMWDEKKHKVERHVNKGRLYDIGPVTFPAYPQTDVKARAMESIIGLDYSVLGAALFKSERGLPLDEKESKLLAKAGEMIMRTKEPKVEIVPEPVIAAARDGAVKRLGRDREKLRFGGLRTK